LPYTIIVTARSGDEGEKTSVRKRIVLARVSAEMELNCPTSTSPLLYDPEDGTLPIHLKFRFGPEPVRPLETLRFSYELRVRPDGEETDVFIFRPEQPLVISSPAAEITHVWAPHNGLLGGVYSITLTGEFIITSGTPGSAQHYSERISTGVLARQELPLLGDCAAFLDRLHIDLDPSSRYHKYHPFDIGATPPQVINATVGEWRGTAEADGGVAPAIFVRGEAIRLRLNINDPSIAGANMSAAFYRVTCEPFWLSSSELLEEDIIANGKSLGCEAAYPNGRTHWYAGEQPVFVLAERLPSHIDRLKLLVRVKIKSTVAPRSRAVIAKTTIPHSRSNAMMAYVIFAEPQFPSEFTDGGVNIWGQRNPWVDTTNPKRSITDWACRLARGSGMTTSAFAKHEALKAMVRNFYDWSVVTYDPDTTFVQMQTNLTTDNFSVKKYLDRISSSLNTVDCASNSAFIHLLCKAVGIEGVVRRHVQNKKSTGWGSLFPVPNRYTGDFPENDNFLTVYVKPSGVPGKCVVANNIISYLDPELNLITKNGYAWRQFLFGAHQFLLLDEKAYDPSVQIDVTPPSILNAVRDPWINQWNVEKGAALARKIPPPTMYISIATAGKYPEGYEHRIPGPSARHVDGELTASEYQAALLYREGNFNAELTHWDSTDVWIIE